MPVNYTVIMYRKNKLVTSLGVVRENYDSSLEVHIFRTQAKVELFLTEELLKDLRRVEADPDSPTVEFRFLEDGLKADQLFEPVVFNATLEAERLFEIETKVKREKEAQERIEREAREVAAKRGRDINDLKRILATYSVQELRDELGEFRL